MLNAIETMNLKHHKRHFGDMSFSNIFMLFSCTFETLKMLRYYDPAYLKFYTDLIGLKNYALLKIKQDPACYTGKRVVVVDIKLDGSRNTKGNYTHGQLQIVTEEISQLFNCNLINPMVRYGYWYTISTTQLFIVVNEDTDVKDMCEYLESYGLPHEEIPVELTASMVPSQPF